MSLDHGLLNVPLHKRGNIDAELDRYAAERAMERGAEAKAAHVVRQAERKQAKAMVRALSDERLAELGAPHLLSVRQTRLRLNSDAHWQPARVIAALSKEPQA